MMTTGKFTDSYLHMHTQACIQYMTGNMHMVRASLCCDLVPMTEIWVNIGSGNGLLPDGTKPLPEPMLTDHQ